MAESIKKYEPNEAVFGAPRAQNGLENPSIMRVLTSVYVFVFREMGISRSHGQLTKWRDVVSLRTARG